jgi:hypothetical protein
MTSTTGSGMVAEWCRDNPLRTDRTGPLERVGVEVARPQDRPFQARRPDGVFQMRGMTSGAHSLGGQQDDAMDAGLAHDGDDAFETAVGHVEARRCQQEQRLGSVKGGAKTLGLG